MQVASNFPQKQPCWDAEVEPKMRHERELPQTHLLMPAWGKANQLCLLALELSIISRGKFRANQVTVVPRHLRMVGQIPRRLWNQVACVLGPQVMLHSCANLSQPPYLSGGDNKMNGRAWWWPLSYVHSELFSPGSHSPALPICPDQAQ